MESRLVAFSRKTRRGAVRYEVGEKYLRDDLGCGRLHGAVVDAATLSGLALGARGGDGAPIGWVVPDTNVVLHQMDVLEHRGGSLDRLVIAQTVAEEVRHNDRGVFRRLCATPASPHPKTRREEERERERGPVPRRGARGSVAPPV